MVIIPPFLNVGGAWKAPHNQSLIINGTGNRIVRTNTLAATDGKIGTLSMFFQVHQIDNNSSLDKCLFYAGNTAASEDNIQFEFNGLSSFQLFMGGKTLNWAAKLRDTGVYHLHMAWDTTQATDSDRVKVTLSGKPITPTGTYPSLNQTYNSGIGDLVEFGSVINIRKLDTHTISDCIWVDGTIEPVETFLQDLPFGNGTTKAPKKPSISAYGNLGCRLQFGNTGDFGEDSSGRGNDFAATGFSSSDQITSVPGDPYAVLSAIDKGPAVIVSDGGLYCTADSLDYIRATQWFGLTGNHFAAKIVGGGDNGERMVGIVNESFNVTPATNTESRTNGVTLDSSSGEVYIDGVSQGTFGAVLTKTVEVLVTDTMVFFLVDGVSIQGDHIAKTGGFLLPAGNIWTFVCGMRSASTNDRTFQWDFGQRGYVPPAGYKTLRFSNLVTPEFLGSDVYSTNIRTGTLAVASVTGVPFQPDFVWSKARAIGDVHVLHDSVRGPLKYLQSMGTNAEITHAGAITSFDADGFTMGSLDRLNPTSAMVDWMWKAGGGAVTNNVGSIESQVSAAPEGHFSVSTFVGQHPTIGTVGVGIDDTEMMILKPANATGGWPVWHTGLTNTQNLQLNTSAAANNPGTAYFDPANNGTGVIGVGANNEANQNGVSMLALCFRSIPGLCKVGSYIGNASTDGTYVHCGFRPSFLLRKWVGAENWTIIDSVRDDLNPNQALLYPNLQNVEAFPTASITTDFLSDGFKLRTADGGVNGSGRKYIYMAMAAEAGGGDLPAVLAA